MFHFEWRYWWCYWNCWVTAKIRPIIDDVTKTAEQKIKKQEGGLLLNETKDFKTKDKSISQNIFGILSDGSII